MPLAQTQQSARAGAGSSTIPATVTTTAKLTRYFVQWLSDRWFIGTFPGGTSCRKTGWVYSNDAVRGTTFFCVVVRSAV
jgi:hypothetical protein